jgi:hypothetical protein
MSQNTFCSKCHRIPSQCCCNTAPRELSDEEIWELHQEYIDEVPCGHSMQTVGFIEFARAILKKAQNK